MKVWSNFSLSSSTLSCPTTVTAKELWEGQPIHRHQALQVISKSKDGIPTDLRCVCSMISNLFCGSILELVILYISNRRSEWNALRDGQGQIWCWQNWLTTCIDLWRVPSKKSSAWTEKTCTQWKRNNDGSNHCLDSAVTTKVERSTKRWNHVVVNQGKRFIAHSLLSTAVTHSFFSLWQYYAWPFMFISSETSKPGCVSTRGC